MQQCYQEVHQQLKLQTQFEAQLSGSTCCSLLFDRNVVFCANVGDSRAVLFSCEGEKADWEAKPMSTDHKPDLPGERQRILESGGRVETLQGSQS
jgi:serine/threonine protein phosphatase PrpC